MDFWNGFTQLKLVMNRRASLSGVKGGEGEEIKRPFPKASFLHSGKQIIRAVVGFTYRVTWLENWKISSTCFLEKKSALREMQYFKSSYTIQYFAGFFLCLVTNDLREEVCLEICFWKLGFASSLTFRSDPSKHLHSCAWPHATRGFCQTNSTMALSCQHHLLTGESWASTGLGDSPQKTKARYFQSMILLLSVLLKRRGKNFLLRFGLIFLCFNAVFFSVTSFLFFFFPVSP